MQTQCNESRIEFHELGERVLTADFEGGNIVSDGGVPLIAEVDRMFGVLEQYAQCFTDHRDQDAIEHSVLDLVRQRIYGLCLGYEDLIDHDRLRTDPLIAACVGKQDLEGQQRRREADRGMPMAGKSTLNRLELAKAGTEMSRTQCPTIRTRLFKIGSLIRVTTRRVWAHFSSSYPYRELFAQVLANLRRHADSLANRSRGQPDLPLPGDGPPRLAVT